MNLFLGSRLPIIFILLLAISLSVFLLEKNLKNFSLLKKRFLATNQKLKEAQERQMLLDNLAKNKSLVEELYRKAIVFLPDKKEVIDFVLKTEQIALANGVSLGNLNFTSQKAVSKKEETEEEIEKKKEKKETLEVPKLSSISEIMISYSLEGNFPAIISYLKGLEETTQANKIENLSLQGMGENLKVSIEEKIFWKEKITIPPSPLALKISPPIQDPFNKISPPQLPSIEGVGRQDPFAPF